MSKNLSAVAKTEFDTEVKHEYQTAGVLMGTTTERKGVNGKIYEFRAMGKGLATQRTAPSGDSIPMNVSHALIPCTLTNWDADEYTDIYDQAEVNFDKVNELATTIAGALGRRDDQLKIDAMEAGTYSATPAAGEGGLVGTDIGGVGSSLNVAKLRRAARYLNKKGVPTSDRHIAISAAALDDLLGETQATSSDYNTVKALVQGEIDTFVGFKFHLVEDREEGGLPITGQLRKCYAYHRRGIGYANAIDMSTNVAYIDVKKSWLSTGSLKAGAVIRDNEGIVEIQITESA